MADAGRLMRLQAMGVVAWRLRSPVAQEEAAHRSTDSQTTPQRAARRAATAHALDTEPAPTAASDAAGAGAALAELAIQVARCTRCELHTSRTKTVFGVGDPKARLMVVGEAPGADEDARGEPFVGRAGRLLDAMLLSIGLARDQVYIANVLKCRPPRNRDPLSQEVLSCSTYLDQQIGLVAPELILTVGRIAAQNLLGVTTPIGKLRGARHVHPGTHTPVMVTYHPAYLLRSPLEKRRAWEDLKQVARQLGIAA